jgi:hypothetical protein
VGWYLADRKHAPVFLAGFNTLQSAEAQLQALDEFLPEQIHE